MSVERRSRGLPGQFADRPYSTLHPAPLHGEMGPPRAARAAAPYGAARGSPERPVRLRGIGQALLTKLLAPRSVVFSRLWVALLPRLHVNDATQANPVERADEVAADLPHRGHLRREQLVGGPSGFAAQAGELVAVGEGSGRGVGDIEDETGMINLVFALHIWDRDHRTLLDAPAVLLAGRIERSACTVNLTVRHTDALSITAPVHRRHVGLR